MDLPPSMTNWLDNLMLTAFAIFSGFIGHLMRVVKSEKKLKWSLAVLEGFASGVVGYIVILLCKALNLSFEWTGVLVGTLGWLGATATIQILERVVLNKLGLNHESTLQQPDRLDRPETSDSGDHSGDVRG